jgi:hypothetical protein
MAEKQPWEMTQAEYINQAAADYVRFKHPLYTKTGYLAMAAVRHEEIIANALNEGRLVPTEVLNEYLLIFSPCQQAAVKKIAEGLRELDTCPLVITKDGTVEKQIPELEQEKRRDNESLETN